MTILISLNKPTQDNATTEFNIVAEHIIGSNNAHISEERYQDYLFLIFLAFGNPLLNAIIPGTIPRIVPMNKPNIATRKSISFVLLSVILKYNLLFVVLNCWKMTSISTIFLLMVGNK